MCASARTRAARSSTAAASCRNCKSLQETRENTSQVIERMLRTPWQPIAGLHTGTWRSGPYPRRARTRSGCECLGNQCCSCAAAGRGANTCARGMQDKCTFPARRRRKHHMKIDDTLQRATGCCSCCCCRCLQQQRLQMS
jgi:hypothetical protein